MEGSGGRARQRARTLRILSRIKTLRSSAKQWSRKPTMRTQSASSWPNRRAESHQGGVATARGDDPEWGHFGGHARRWLVWWTKRRGICGEARAQVRGETQRTNLEEALLAAFFNLSDRDRVRLWQRENLRRVIRDGDLESNTVGKPRWWKTSRGGWSKRFDAATKRSRRR